MDKQYEPVARLVRQRMEAAGYRVADLEVLTGLDRRHLSQIINRHDHYVDAPKIATLQALAKIPGVTLEEVALAVAQSIGLPIPMGDPDLRLTPMRRSVRAVIDKLPEEELPRALQILTSLL